MNDRTHSNRSLRSRRGRLATPALSRLSSALGNALEQSSRIPAPAMAPPARTLAHRHAWRAAAPAPRVRSISPARARAHRYRMSPRLQANGKGLALIELMIVVGTIMAVSGGIFALYKVADSNQRADREIRNAGEIAENLTRVMAAGVDFSDLDQQYAIDHGVYPTSMVGDGASASTSWGGITIEPTEINSVPNQGALISYNNVPSSSCASFVRGASNGFYEIRINDQLLRSNFAEIQPTALANLCASSANVDVDLVFARNAGTGLAVDELAPCVAPPTETSVSSCPPGQLGSITRQRDFACSSAYGPADPGPWSAPVSTCAPICVLPSPNPEYENGARTASRSRACPSGQVTPSGASSFTQTRNEERTRSRTANCPAPTGPYSWGAWGAWSSWTAVSGPAGIWGPTNGCAPKCVLPTPSTKSDVQTRTNTRELECPAGQLGVITQTRPEQRTRTSTASCPAPTGAYAWGPWSSWSGWSGTAPWTTKTNTCAPICQAPPTTNTQESRSVSCPSGQVTAGGASSFTQKRTRTNTYTCPAPTGPYTPNDPTYTGWSPSVSSTCAPKCVAPAPTTQSRNGPVDTESANFTKAGTPASKAGDKVNRTAYLCATGQYGHLLQNRTSTVYRTTTIHRTGTRTRSTTQTRTVTYSCPTPTGDVKVTYGAYGPAGAPYGNWSGWSYGPYGAPTGPYGQWGAPSAPFGNWTTYDNNCVNCPSPTTERKTQWADYTSYNCPAGHYGYNKRQREQESTRSKTYVCPAGTKTLPPVTNGPWSAWSNTGNTRDVAGTNCVDCPAPSTQTQNHPDNPFTYNVAACPAGYYGYYGRAYDKYRTRTKSYSCPSGTRVLPAPDYTPYSDWKNGTIRTTSDHCVSCPPDKKVDQYRWEDRTKACSNPYWNGQINYEQRQHRTYYQNWDCPAQTLNLPNPTNDRFTPYTWQSNTRNTVNNCSLPSCGSTLETQAKRYMAANQDLYNAFAGNWQAAKNHWNNYGWKENRSGSCWPKPPQNCVIPSSPAVNRSWGMCSGSVPAGTIPNGAYATVFGSGGPPLNRWIGSAEFKCTNGVLSSTATNPVCNPINPPCPPGQICPIQ